MGFGQDHSLVWLGFYYNCQTPNQVENWELNLRSLSNKKNTKKKIQLSLCSAWLSLSLDIEEV